MLIAYTYTVRWSREDQAYLGRVQEFPSLGVHAASAVGALREIMKVVRMVLEEMEAEGEQPPLPQGAELWYKEG